MHEKGSHIWNIQWYKTTREGYCPDCGKPFLHKGKVWQCPRCGLYILGAPETLAYVKKREISKKAPTSDDKCPECEGLDYEYNDKHDETICKGCGLLLQGPPGYSKHIPIYYPWGHNYDTGEINKF